MLLEIPGKAGNASGSLRAGKVWRGKPLGLLGFLWNWPDWERHAGRKEKKSSF